MMNIPIPQFPSEKSLNLLSRLLLERDADEASKQDLRAELVSLSHAQLEDMLTLAQLNHVVLRGLGTFEAIVREAGDAERAGWAHRALDVESARIDTAVHFLDEICAAFEGNGYGVSVIKSLDHWPDIGSDLDLYTDAHPEQVCRLMQNRFHASIAARSWGDRLACKWNFEIPGLPEAVEVHVGRLGQTGEQVAIASSLLARARQMDAGDRRFRVTSVSDRLLISALQRMYRHFYFRLCDIVDSAQLVETGAIDYDDLREAAIRAGIWKGMATYLAIVSYYVKSLRGIGLKLPQTVTDAVQFGGKDVYYARGFLRVPILPQSAQLYTAQFAGVLGKGDLQNCARLSLLPWLATAAVVGQRLTGSDKGIW